jgi:AcrR family transcriptional regulator
MSPSVNPPRTRTYDASRRRAQARQTRLLVLEVAHRRFISDGYRATTLARIATDSEVSVQTITKQFGNKAGLVKALFDAALVGDDEPTPLAARDFITAIHEEPDPRRKIHLYATVLATMLPRTAPIQLLIREAAADPAAGELWELIKTGRLIGMTDFANNLADGNHLRSELTVEAARDILWTYSSPELYELLVLQRGHTNEAYASFVETGAAAALLADRSDPTPSRSR